MITLNGRLRLVVSSCWHKKWFSLRLSVEWHHIEQPSGYMSRSKIQHLQWRDAFIGRYAVLLTARNVSNTFACFVLYREETSGSGSRSLRLVSLCIQVYAEMSTMKDKDGPATGWHRVVRQKKNSKTITVIYLNFSEHFPYI